MSYSQRKLTPFAEKRINQIVDNLYKYQRISDIEYAAAKADITEFIRNTEPMTEDGQVEVLTKDFESTEETSDPEDD